jgi:hypothetical protein
MGAALMPPDGVTSILLSSVAPPPVTPRRHVRPVGRIRSGSTHRAANRRSRPRLSFAAAGGNRSRYRPFAPSVLAFEFGKNRGESAGEVSQPPNDNALEITHSLGRPRRGSLWVAGSGPLVHSRPQEVLHTRRLQSGGVFRCGTRASRRDRGQAAVAWFHAPQSEIGKAKKFGRRVVVGIAPSWQAGYSS